MKEISMNRLHILKVDYFGLTLFIPMDYLYGYICVDSLGWLCAYSNKPDNDDTSWNIGSSGCGYSAVLGKVDLEGMDWKETCVCVQSLNQSILKVGNK